MQLLITEKITSFNMLNSHFRPDCSASEDPVQIVVIVIVFSITNVESTALPLCSTTSYYPPPRAHSTQDLLTSSLQNSDRRSMILVAAPQVWNSQIRNCETIATIKKNFKIYLVRQGMK